MKKVITIICITSSFLISCENQKSNNSKLNETTDYVLQEESEAIITFETLQLVSKNQENDIRIAEIMDSLDYHKYDYGYKSAKTRTFKYSRHLIKTFPFTEFSTLDENLFLKIQNEIGGNNSAEKINDLTGDLIFKYRLNDFNVETYYPLKNVESGSNTRFQIILNKKQ